MKNTETLNAKIKQVKKRLAFATLNETRLLLSALDFYYTELSNL
jgi:hypothetical protein